MWLSLFNETAPARLCSGKMGHLELNSAFPEHLLYASKGE